MWRGSNSWLHWGKNLAFWSRKGDLTEDEAKTQAFGHGVIEPQEATPEGLQEVRSLPPVGASLFPLSTNASAPSSLENVGESHKGEAHPVIDLEQNLPAPYGVSERFAAQLANKRNPRDFEDAGLRFFFGFMKAFENTVDVLDDVSVRSSLKRIFGPATAVLEHAIRLAVAGRDAKTSTRTRAFELFAPFADRLSAALADDLDLRDDLETSKYSKFRTIGRPWDTSSPVASIRALKSRAPVFLYQRGRREPHRGLVVGHEEWQATQLESLANGVLDDHFETRRRLSRLVFGEQTPSTVELARENREQIRSGNEPGYFDFLPSLEENLTRLKPGERWGDIGPGQAGAIAEFHERWPNSGVRAIPLAMFRPENVSEEQAASLGFHFLNRPIEECDPAEVIRSIGGKLNLATMLLSAQAYAVRHDRVLETTGELLAPGGVLLTHIPFSFSYSLNCFFPAIQVVDEENRPVSYLDYLRAIDGLELIEPIEINAVDSSGAHGLAPNLPIALRRTGETPVRAPKLEPVFVQNWRPPTFVFRWNRSPA